MLRHKIGEIGVDGKCIVCGILTKNLSDYGYICCKCEKNGC